MLGGTTIAIHPTKSLGLQERTDNMADKLSVQYRIPNNVWTRAIAIVLVLAFLLTSLAGGFASQSAPLKQPSQAASGWEIETVDSGRDVGKYTSLELDGSGYSHVSYFDDTNNDLMYAYQDVSGWHIETADSGFLYGYTSLALDGSEHPHISYYGASSKGLRYAHKDAAGWHQETVSTVSAEYLIGRYSSVALDTEGYPHISYYKEYNYRGYLQYAYQDASGWHIEVVENPEGSGRYPGQYTSLAMDGDGYPHISYFHNSDMELKYAYMDASGWHIGTVDSAGSVGKHTSLELDNSGYPHISYLDSTHNDLKYAYMDASGWHIGTVDSAGNVGSYTSLDLDASGRPSISYCDFGNADLKYAYLDASGWHIETVDSEGSVGEYTSLALDETGAPHIAYYDASNAVLKYAHFAGDVPGTGFSVFLPVTIRE
jgi:hypothetical protein